MVKKFGPHRKKFKHHIKADVIILGCSLPGIVTAHNLKKKFGDTVDIVVLDLIAPKDRTRALGISVAFEDQPDKDDDGDETPPTTHKKKTVYDNVARFFLEKYADDFNIPLPDNFEQSQHEDSSLRKLFQHINGNTVPCSQNYHDFDYLSYLERFEVAQYHKLLDRSMQHLFSSNAANSLAERQRLLYFDQTTMEIHLCKHLFFMTSQEVMRTIVELVCGTRPQNISVLFYLHQCYRVSSSTNHLGGDNTRFREKLLGRFRRRIANKLQQSIADITLSTKTIKEIRTAPDERVILEPEIGETDYICNLLAMALKPDELRNIVMETKLISPEEREFTNKMVEGEAIKFVIEYEENFWQPQGYSGDILSIRGPIIWAMERPIITKTRESDKYAALVGYLRVDKTVLNSKDEVIQQLVKLFGEEAANPVNYIERPIKEIYIPQIGDYLKLRKLTTECNSKLMEWGALDIFAEGDVAASIEAGHAAYLHLLSVLRPQAVTYEDMVCQLDSTNFFSPYGALTASLNLITGTKLLVLGVGIIVGIHFLRSGFRKQ